MLAKLKKLPSGIRHSAWSVADAAIYPAVYLATVPLLMKHLGQQGFGLWIILTSLIIILQLFNFNLGITAMRNISYELANGNKKGVSDIINVILRVSSVLLLVAAFTGWVLTETAVPNGWWGLDEAQGEDLRLCVFSASIIAGLRYFDQAFQGIIKARERFRLASLLNMANRFGILAINLILAISGYSIGDMLLANILYLVCYLLVQFYFISRILPFYRGLRISDPSQYKKLLGYGIWPWLQALVVALTFQTDRFWVSSFGLDVVSEYGLVSTMFNHIHIIFTAMAVWMMPRIAAMTSRGDDPSRLYHQVRGGLFGLVVFSLLFFYFISPAIFPVWVGAETYTQMKPFIQAFTAFELVFVHSILPILYLNAAGKERLATRVTLFYCLGCYTFMLAGLWLTKSPVGLIEGMTAAICLSMPLVNVLTGKAMQSRLGWEHRILEMTPMYAAIFLLYAGNIWLDIALVIAAFWLLWKFYLADVFKNGVWKLWANT